eukprot:252600-Pleurochrysis_carterae.AAC.1
MLLEHLRELADIHECDTTLVRAPSSLGAQSLFSARKHAQSQTYALVMHSPHQVRRVECGCVSCTFTCRAQHTHARLHRCTRTRTFSGPASLRLIVLVDRHTCKNSLRAGALTPTHSLETHDCVSTCSCASIHTSTEAKRPARALTQTTGRGHSSAIQAMDAWKHVHMRIRTPHVSKQASFPTNSPTAPRLRCREAHQQQSASTQAITRDQQHAQRAPAPRRPREYVHVRTQASTHPCQRECAALLFAGVQQDAVTRTPSCDLASTCASINAHFHGSRCFVPRERLQGRSHEDASFLPWQRKMLVPRVCAHAK